MSDHECRGTRRGPAGKPSADTGASGPGDWGLADPPGARVDKRRARLAPRARVWPSRIGKYPALLPTMWYPLLTSAEPDPQHVWLQTSRGLTRVDRVDVELLGM